MRYLDLNLGPRVSAIGLGTWQFGAREWGYGPDYDDREAGAIVRRALELGVTLFDTAEIYGRGRSEAILGAALRAAGMDRDQVFLATKVMPVLPSAAVVEQRAVASLRRLGVRHLDLYQVHQPNPLTPDSRLMRGMASLQRVGLVRHVGVSNYSLSRWRAADAALAAAREELDGAAATGADRSEATASRQLVSHEVVSNQVQYSLVHRAPEDDLLPFAAAERRMVIAYSPLAQGFLSAKAGPGDPAVSGVRALNPLFLKENVAAASEVFSLLRDIAATHGASAAQVALAWVVRHGCVAAIPGASSVAQLESNVAAAELRLGEDEVAALDAASRRFRPVTGARSVAPLLRARLRRPG